MEQSNLTLFKNVSHKKKSVIAFLFFSTCYTPTLDSALICCCFLICIRKSPDLVRVTLRSSRNHQELDKTYQTIRQSTSSGRGP